MMTYNRIKDVVMVIVILFAVMILTVLYINTAVRNQVKEKLYPVTARLALTHLSCSHDSPAWMEQILTDITKYKSAPANQIAYITTDGQVSHCESGYVDKPIISKPVTEHTRFRIASLTKLFTADYVLHLVNTNRLSLDDRLVDLLPEINNPIDKRIESITVRMLLSHRMGLDRYQLQNDDMFDEYKKPWCPNDLEKLNHIKLDFEPDTKAVYANIGYCLLGAVIEKIQQKSYESVMADYYNFDKQNLKFIQNYKYDDEVSYHYVSGGLIGYSDIYSVFDYPSLASAAGLSGSAVAIAKSIKTMQAKTGLNILTQDEMYHCDARVISQECYGLAMNQYEPKAEFSVYYKTGALLGLTAISAVDDQGGVIVLLSSGTPDNGLEGVIDTQQKIYDHLYHYYNQ